jgi:hypothetical protein
MMKLTVASRNIAKASEIEKGHKNSNSILTQTGVGFSEYKCATLDNECTNPP